jgi:hypothetical protein
MTLTPPSSTSLNSTKLNSTPLNLAPNEANDFDLQVTLIRESGILERSNHLHRLFEYLYSCSLSGKLPKEIEIAIEGLGRDKDFDATQDALVRVYIHKLRQKLDDFYRKEGQAMEYRLVVPKGEYRLLLTKQHVDAQELPDDNGAIEVLDTKLTNRHWRSFTYVLVGVLIISVALNFLQLLKQSEANAGYLKDVRAKMLWSSLFADDRPIVIVVGDYYIYAETDGDAKVRRLVRDFDLNSAMELSNHLQLYPNQAERKFDVGLSYLPTSTAPALSALSPILTSGKKQPKVMLASELTPEIIRNDHIVYIGHLSGMGVLSDAVFDASRFHIGSGFDELIDNTSRQVYASNSGIPHSVNGNSRHLAYLASLVGPSGNRIIVTAGFRDAGLKELANVVSSPAELAALEAQNTGASFEAIYQIASVGNVTAPAKILTTHPTQVPLEP